MKAQALIGGTTYGPDALKVIWKAFDDAWAHIQHHFDGDVHQAGSASKAGARNPGGRRRYQQRPGRA